jgi:hypothetical protein
MGGFNTAASKANCTNVTWFQSVGLNTCGSMANGLKVNGFRGNGWKENGLKACCVKASGCSAGLSRA